MARKQAKAPRARQRPRGSGRATAAKPPKTKKTKKMSASGAGRTPAGRSPKPAGTRKKAPAGRTKAAVQSGNVAKKTAVGPGGTRAAGVRKATGGRRTAPKTPAATSRRNAAAAARPATKKTASKVASTRAPRAARVKRRPVQDARSLPTPAALLRERRRLPETEGEDFTLNGDNDMALGARGDELRAELLRHTEGGPSLTAGDVDARWQDAYAQGDESPGGDNPTPDQDRVDDIGRALGIQYNDEEELLGGDEIAERDAHRWEWDPASREDADE